jgi:tetracycline resistance efflux pump
MGSMNRAGIWKSKHFAAGLTGGLVLISYGFLLLPSEIRVFWPPLVALIVVFITHRAALGLFAAGLAGSLLLTAGHPLAALHGWVTGHAWPALFGSWKPGDPVTSLVADSHHWHLGAIVFTLLLGAFAAILERGGGLLRLLSRGGAATNPGGARRFLTSVFGLGLVCFFDGLANSLMVGRVARPVADRLRIPRALLAYLVDTTSSAVACLAFISTWIAVQLTLIDDGMADLALDEPAYLLFLRSIPHNYYCLFALCLAFLTIRRGWLIGPMRSAAPVAELPPHDPAEAPEATPLFRAILPLLVLVLAIPTLYYFLHRGEGIPPRFPISLAKIQAALGSDTGPPAFVLGSGLALLAAVLCMPPRLRGQSGSIALGGARQLAPALGVLILAWILGSILGSLGTARQLASILGEGLPIRLLPAATFLLGCLMSFVSGTSWGTMALLMPLALPALGPMAVNQGAPPELLAALAPAVIAAVFGGAVFGDHCSPFSDTTIVSSLACGITTPQHTITQLPYALIAAGTTLLAGYLPEALGLPAWAALLAGGTILLALTSFRRRSG